MDSTLPAPDTMESERAFYLIRSDIIAGRIPPDAKLKIASLRERYQIGAAPLREALSRLAGDRLVVQQSQRGFRVREMSIEDVTDLGRIRILLECEGISESLRNGTDEWEANLVATYHRLQLTEQRHATEPNHDELEARNTDFHNALISGSKSFWLKDLRWQVYTHHERYRYLSRSSPASGRNTPAEHMAIFQSAIKRDAKTTCELVTEHIDLTTKMTIRLLSAGSVRTYA